MRFILGLAEIEREAVEVDLCAQICGCDYVLDAVVRDIDTQKVKNVQSIYYKVAREGSTEESSRFFARSAWTGEGLHV
ncbi:MAG: hypothetical protein WC375_01810 [Methanomassiliicoccales archaeon]